MSMSLDGFIAGPNVTRSTTGSATAGERLHEWHFKGEQGIRQPEFDESWERARSSPAAAPIEPAARVGRRPPMTASRSWLLSRHEPPDWASRWNAAGHHFYLNDVEHKAIG